GAVHHRAVLQERDALNVVQRLALGKLDDRIIELFAADEINRGTITQRFLRKHGYVRADKRDLNGRVSFLDFLYQLNIAGKAGCTGEQHQELIPRRDFDGFLRRNVVRWRIQKARALKHASGISEPNRIPIRFDLARSWPPRSGPTIKILKRRWVQKKSLQRHS